MQYSGMSKKVLSYALSIIIVALVSIDGYGQTKQFKLHVHENMSAQDTSTYKWNNTDSVGAWNAARSWVNIQHNKGYLLANADTVVFSEQIAHIFLYKGPRYEVDVYSISQINAELPQDVLRQIRLSEKGFLTQKSLAKLEKELLVYYASHGYPFSQVKMDSVTAVSSNISFRLAVKPGPLIKFDTLIVVGDKSYKQNYLQNHLGIRTGKNYDQKKVDDSFALIGSLPGVRPTKKPEVIFKNNKAYIVYNIKRQSVSTIDGIIGLLPNEGTSKRVLITGEFTIDLKNLFRSGKEFFVEWRRLQPLSQQLTLAYKHPYIFNSYLSPQVEFKLLKQDSTFINVSRAIGFGFNLNPKASMSIGTRFYTTRLLSTTQYSAFNVPLFLDSDYLSYTLGLNWSNTDDKFFPKRGVQILSNFEIGNKSIVRNAGLDEVLYEGLPDRSFQFRLHALIKYYKKLGKQTLLFLKSESGIVENKVVRLNDLFRVGGFNSLRGFNEYNFYAQRFSIATAEFRVFTDESSYVYLFYDQSWISYDVGNSSFSDTPLGFGAGVSFSTGRGIFNFAYSLGYSKEQPLALNLSKVHFGLISKF